MELLSLVYIIFINHLIVNIINDLLNMPLEENALNINRIRPFIETFLNHFYLLNYISIILCLFIEQF